jgi:hypothetical protein
MEGDAGCGEAALKFLALVIGDDATVSAIRRPDEDWPAHNHRCQIHHQAGPHARLPGVAEEQRFAFRCASDRCADFRGDAGDGLRWGAFGSQKRLGGILEQLCCGAAIGQAEGLDAADKVEEHWGGGEGEVKVCGVGQAARPCLSMLMAKRALCVLMPFNAGWH